MPKTLLCVDDDERSLLLRAELLRLHEFNVLGAISGDEALRILHHHHVDLVTLDYEMPHMNGAVLAGEIRKLRPKIPIMMVSGREIGCRSMAPVDAFLLKDWPTEFFLEVVHMFSRRVHSSGKRIHRKLRSVKSVNTPVRRGARKQR